MHTPDVRAAARLPSPLCVLVARAEARALLYAAGEFDLPDAVDPLQAFAAESGLLDEIGQDAVRQFWLLFFQRYKSCALNTTMSFLQASSKRATVPMPSRLGLRLCHQLTAERQRGCGDSNLCHSTS